MHYNFGFPKRSLESRKAKIIYESPARNLRRISSAPVPASQAYPTKQYAKRNVIKLRVKYRFVIAKAKPEAIQDIVFKLDCFASLAMTGNEFFLKLMPLP
jgi:hypothetical protein